MCTDELVEQERILNRFRRLMKEVVRGVTARNAFEPWEIVLLMDLDTCDLPPRHRIEILRQYEKAVERQLDCGPGPPIKFSEFLLKRNNAAAVQPPAAGKN